MSIWHRPFLVLQQLRTNLFVCINLFKFLTHFVWTCCSLHWQQQELIISTTPQNGLQNRYDLVKFTVSYCEIIYFDLVSLGKAESQSSFSFQGSLNKFHGQHALRERAKKINQGILIIRYQITCIVLKGWWVLVCLQIFYQIW